MIILMVFDNGDKIIDRYTVIIDDDVFSMSGNANIPNGCNYYVGKLKSIPPETLTKEIKDIQSLPEGLRIGITKRLYASAYKSAYGLSLFEIFELLGIEIGNHESDLYVKVTPESRCIVDVYEYKKQVTTFHFRGELWFNIPFAFDPFWDKKSNIKGRK